jgi:hypothetical protein
MKFDSTQNKFTWSWIGTKGTSDDTSDDVTIFKTVNYTISDNTLSFNGSSISLDNTYLNNFTAIYNNNTSYFFTNYDDAKNYLKDKLQNN